MYSSKFNLIATGIYYEFSVGLVLKRIPFFKCHLGSSTFFSNFIIVFFKHRLVKTLQLINGAARFVGGLSHHIKKKQKSSDLLLLLILYLQTFGKI